MGGTLFIVWTVVGATALTLAAVHGLVWLLDRRGLANLAFCVVALSVGALARIEFGMMQAGTAAEYAAWVRLFHLPLFFLTAGLVLFIGLHFGTGRAWLGWTVIAMRGIVSLANIASGPGATWQVIHVDQVPWLGGLASASTEATVRPLQWLATAAALLFIVYASDAALALWRKGDRDSRRTALVVGGSIVGFLVLATLQSQLIVLGVLRMPVMVSVPFLTMLAAMTYELCRHIVASAGIEGEARRLRDELAHVARVSTLSELSGSLAHELNQPLGAILRNAEAAAMLLAAPEPDLAELRAIIADIHSDDRRAGAIIQRMRAFLSRNSLELQRVSLHELVQDVLALVRSDAAARHVTIESAVPESLPAVTGDRVQISQVLLNLLVNGIDAVCDSTSRARKVVIDARPGDGRTVEVTVADSGRGIAPDVLPRVFDPFVTTKPKGMGIGLAVSRTIVEAHGGRLSAQNNATGKEMSGATFRFTLPVARGAA